MLPPKNAYNQPPTSNNPREIEAWALMKSATRLEEAKRAPDDDEELRQSLRINQILWTILQSAVLNEETPLPDNLRADIISLSLTVDRQTFARLADLDREKLVFLIDVNRNMAMGLMTKPATEEAASEDKPETVQDPQATAVPKLDISG